MPAIVNLYLVPRSVPASLPYLGEAVRAVIYDSMRLASPEFAQRLHADNDYKPFVASAPIRPRVRTAGQTDVGEAASGAQPAWRIRCGCLDEELADKLLLGLWERYSAQEEIRLGPAEFSFGNPPWRVTDVIRYEEMLRPTEGRQWRFRFVSPMAVTCHSRPVPLPVPDLLFRGLAIKWNRVAPESLRIPEELVGEMPDRIELLSCRGGSRQVRLANHGEVGFVGEAMFRVTGPDGSAVQAAGVMARFAAYAGVGRKTTIGMGQVMVEEG